MKNSAAWSPVNFAQKTDSNYMSPPHIMKINVALLELFNGRNDRLIVNMPPRHGKSWLCSMYFPAWHLCKRPKSMVMLTSYSSTFATLWGKRTRNIIQEYGNKYFGVRVSSDTRAKGEWEMAGHGGIMKATGVGGDITGRGADILIVDDPVKNYEEAFSKKIRDNIWEWFTSTAYTRLEPNGKIVLIMTRWHSDDLAGRLLSNDEYGEWQQLILPSLARADDPLGRKEGEALWPDRYDADRLKKIRRDIGSFMFSALYQQDPMPSDSQIFDPEWWQYYSGDVDVAFKIQTWDTAFKKEEKNDYSVCSTWGINQNGYFLIDRLKAKMVFPDLIREVRKQHAKHKPRAVLIEDAASGQDLISTLKREAKIKGIEAIPPKNKVIRAHATTPLVEAGEVFLPKDAPWLDDFVSEHSAFPDGSHDDQVDTTTMSLEFLKDRMATIKRGRRTVISASKNNIFKGYD